jgi:hypothetical protein
MWMECSLQTTSKQPFSSTQGLNYHHSKELNLEHKAPLIIQPLFDTLYRRVMLSPFKVSYLSYELSQLSAFPPSPVSRPQSYNPTISCLIRANRSGAHRTGAHPTSHQLQSTSYNLPAMSYHLSAMSYELSAISFSPRLQSYNSFQLSALSFELSAFPPVPGLPSPVNQYGAHRTGAHPTSHYQL